VVSMREKISEIVLDYMLDSMSDQDDAADTIIAALPEMIAPLVWSEDENGHLYSRDYVLIKFLTGYLVDTNDLSLGHDFTLEAAIEKANAHHRASIMAAFTGETT
jgi:hypothetical protein